MNSDPFLVGVDTAFPNQNSSTAPTVWAEDTLQAAEQGIPCVAGPMLTLTKQSSSLPVLPGGAVNPCPEANPVCVIIDNVRTDAGASQRLSAAFLAAGTVGGEFIGGGNGVAGTTLSPSSGQAGVFGDSSTGGIGVVGRSQKGSGIGVRGLGSSQAVRGDGGSFGVVGRGSSTSVDGRGVGAGSFGVVGVGGVAGVWGGDSRTGGIGVVGVPGPFNGTVTPWAGRFDGSVLVGGRLFVNGSLFVFGGKSAVVPHPDGSQRAAYAVEAPESWLEDVGRARLRQGVARVELDPDFAAVSGIGDDYHVFVTPEGPCNGLYVTDRGPSGFDVREQGKGTADISFSYRVMTRRTDVRTRRLEPVSPYSPDGEKTDARPEPLPSPSPEPPAELTVEPDDAPGRRAA